MSGYGGQLQRRRRTQWGGCRLHSREKGAGGGGAVIVQLWEFRAQRIPKAALGGGMPSTGLLILLFSVRITVLTLLGTVRDFQELS